MSTPLIGAIPVRGVATRDALLDAAESMISDYGFNEPSHRTIASAAGVHAALLNYHFGSKEMLFEAAVARRADRLNEGWRTALAALRTRGTWEVEDVLNAWWHPFHAIRRDDNDAAWRNYVCVIGKDPLKISLVGIGGVDLVDGNKKLTLALGANIGTDVAL